MKRFLYCILLMVSVHFANAQAAPKSLKADIKTPTAKCADCKTKIEAFVTKNIDGLVKINVRYSSGLTSVQYYPDRTNIEEIKTAISNAGFDADDVIANPDVYQTLPDCCKKPEDRKTQPPAKKQ